MGREGEVVVRLLPEFERAQSGHPRRSPAAAVDRGAREAADGVRRRRDARHLPARQHLDSGIRCARRARAPRRPADDIDGGPRPISSRASGTPTSWRDARTAFRGTSIRVCSSTGAISSTTRAFAVPPASWPDWMRTLAAVKARARPNRYAILLPLNEVEPLLALALQQDDPLLRDDGRYGNFDSPGFRRALGVLRRHVPRRLRAAVHRIADDQRMERVRPRHVRVLHLGAVEHRRVRAAASCRRAACVGDGAAARTERSGRIDRRRLEPGRLPRIACEGCGVEADRIPLARRRPGAIPRADRRPAAAPERVARPGARGRRACPGVSRPARTRQARAQGARVGAHRR